MLGSWLNYLLYVDHYRITEDEDAIRGTFCTAPAIRNFKNNFFSEALGTFVLIFGIFFIASPNIVIDGVLTENFGIGSLEALPVALLVWVIGMALGGTTGYAINPARDFGPRLVYQLLPRKNKNGRLGLQLDAQYWALIRSPYCRCALQCLNGLITWPH